MSTNPIYNPTHDSDVTQIATTPPPSTSPLEAATSEAAQEALSTLPPRLPTSMWPLRQPLQQIAPKQPTQEIDEDEWDDYLVEFAQNVMQPPAERLTPDEIRANQANFEEDLKNRGLVSKEVHPLAQALIMLMSNASEIDCVANPDLSKVYSSNSIDEYAETLTCKVQAELIEELFENILNQQELTSADFLSIWRLFEISPFRSKSWIFPIFLKVLIDKGFYATHQALFAFSQDLALPEGIEPSLELFKQRTRLLCFDYPEEDTHSNIVRATIFKLFKRCLGFEKQASNDSQQIVQGRLKIASQVIYCHSQQSLRFCYSNDRPTPFDFLSFALKFLHHEDLLRRLLKGIKDKELGLPLGFIEKILALSKLKEADQREIDLIWLQLIGRLTLNETEEFLSKLQSEQLYSSTNKLHIKGIINAIFPNQINLHSPKTWKDLLQSIFISASEFEHLDVIQMFTPHLGKIFAPEDFRECQRLLTNTCLSSLLFLKPEIALSLLENHTFAEEDLETIARLSVPLGLITVFEKALNKLPQHFVFLPPQHFFFQDENHDLLDLIAKTIKTLPPNRAEILDRVLRVRLIISPENIEKILNKVLVLTPEDFIYDITNTSPSLSKPASFAIDNLKAAKKEHPDATWDYVQILLNRILNPPPNPQSFLCFNLPTLVKELPPHRRDVLELCIQKTHPTQNILFESLKVAIQNNKPELCSCLIEQMNFDEIRQQLDLNPLAQELRTWRTQGIFSAQTIENVIHNPIPKAFQKLGTFISLLNNKGYFQQSAILISKILDYCDQVTPALEEIYQRPLTPLETLQKVTPWLPDSLAQTYERSKTNHQNNQLLTRLKRRQIKMLRRDRTIAPSLLQRMKFRASSLSANTSLRALRTVRNATLEFFSTLLGVAIAAPFFVLPTLTLHLILPSAFNENCSAAQGYFVGIWYLYSMYLQWALLKKYGLV